MLVPYRSGILCTRLKRLAPRLQICSLCQEALALPRVRRHRARHPPGKGPGVTTCPEAPCVPLTKRGLQCCHVPRGIEPITRQEKAPESPHASWLQARPLHRKALASPRDRGLGTTAPQGFGTDTCPAAPDPPPGAEGSGATTCLVALGPRAYPCVPKTSDIMPIMASPGMRCRQRIKYVSDRPYTAYGRL
jgi:hypothetical protein